MRVETVVFTQHNLCASNQFRLRLKNVTHANERHGDEDPVQGVEIRHERQDGGLGFSQNALGYLNARSTQCSHTGRPAALNGKALRQHLARRWRVLGEGGRADREALAPLARGAEINMDETRARIEAVAVSPGADI